MSYRVTLRRARTSARRLRGFSPAEAAALVATVRRTCPEWVVTCEPRGGEPR